MDRKISIPLIIFLLALALYAIGLGGTALLDPDEPVYGQTAREMAETGSWLTPRLNGLLWFDKPPMYFWLAAASFKIFSVSEFAARFPSCLMAAMLLALIYIWARRAFDESTALYSAVTLASSLLFVFIARAAVTDMTLCFFMNLSFYMIYLAMAEPENRFKYVSLFYFFSGFSVLTKGPVGLVLPLLVIVPFLAARRDWKFLRALYSPFGFLLFFVSALPWYIAMLVLHGGQFFNTFIGYHNLIRFLEPEHVRTSSLFFYAPVLIVGFFPHTAALGAFIADFFRSAFSRDFYGRYIFPAPPAPAPAAASDCGAEGTAVSVSSATAAAAALSFFIFISAGVFGFFSIAKTKLVTYILPMFPAFAVLLGRTYRNLEASGRKNFSGALLTLLLGSGLAYGFYRVAPAKVALADPSPFLNLAYITAAITAANLFLCFISRRRRELFYITCALTASFLITLNLRLLPQFSDLYSARAICSVIRKEMAPGESLGYFSKTPSALFYSSVPITHVNESASSRIGQGELRRDGEPAAHNNPEAVKKDDFVRKLSPVGIEEAYKYLDKFRKLRNFLSHKEKVYVIMLNSDYQKFSQEIRLKHTRGPAAGKYTYITNR